MSSSSAFLFVTSLLFTFFELEPRSAGFTEVSFDDDRVAVLRRFVSEWPLVLNLDRHRGVLFALLDEALEVLGAVCGCSLSTQANLNCCEHCALAATVVSDDEVDQRSQGHR